jgi:hypothetical protein
MTLRSLKLIQHAINGRFNSGYVAQARAPSQPPHFRDYYGISNLYKHGQASKCRFQQNRDTSTSL